MAAPASIATRVAGLFSQRISGPLGGNRHAGPFEEMPLSLLNERRFMTYFNDFVDSGHYDETNDWVVADIGTAAGSGDALATRVSQTSSVHTNNGILRITAGSADSTGRQATRNASGANLGGYVGVLNGQRVVFGVRFRYNETGTAGQSAILLAMCRDEQALLSTAGAQQGSVAQFGFYKGLASSTLIGYFNGSNDPSAGVSRSMGTLTPGTAINTGTFHEAIIAFERNASAAQAFFWLDGAYVGTATNGGGASVAPPTSSNYGLTLAAVNGVGADAILDVDYYFTVCRRSA